MNQTIVWVLVIGLLIAVGIILYLTFLIRQKDEQSKLKDTPMPFSEPRPFPEPKPPVRMPAAPVVPVADPNIRPVRFAYDQRYFEHFYSPFEGHVMEILAKEGDMVEKGTILMKIKYQDSITELRASASGRLRKINCKAGTAFRRDELLYIIQ